MNQPQVSSWAKKPELRIGAVIAIALAFAFIVWLIVRGGGGGSSSETTASTPTLPAVGPTIVGVTQLGTFADKAGHQVYWAGPIANKSYEFTQTPKASIYIRYLPQGTRAGSKALFPLVGSYPVNDAYKVLQSLAKKQGEISFPAPGSGIAVYSTMSPTNIYLAYPNSNVQIEVFDPSPKQARAMITSGQIAPVP